MLHLERDTLLGQTAYLIIAGLIYCQWHCQNMWRLFRTHIQQCDGMAGRTHPAECCVGTLAGQDVILNLSARDVKTNKLHLLGVSVISSQWPTQDTHHVNGSTSIPL